jgi:hypothetical protein
MRWVLWGVRRWIKRQAAILLEKTMMTKRTWVANMSWDVSVRVHRHWHLCTVRFLEGGREPSIVFVWLDSSVLTVVLFTGAAGMSDCILRRIVGHRFSYTRFSIRDGRIVLSYLVDAKQARLIKIRRYHA